jgi:CheY-like chemotaxis protein
LTLYEKNRDKIDLVFLDMVMPEMGGGATFDRLKKKDPDIKVLLFSGYSRNGQVEEILEKGCRGFIQKPFSMEELSIKLERVLHDGRDYPAL